MSADDPATPLAVWFRLGIRWKLPRGATGLTSLDSKGISAADALGVILDEFPDDAVTIDQDQDGLHDRVTIVIDWARVPDSLRNPVIPRRR